MFRIQIFTLPFCPPYLVDLILTDDHADLEVFVDHRERAVLELPGHDPLAVHVGQLLDLESPLETGREVEAASHHQQTLLLVDLVGNRRHLRVQLQNAADHLCKMWDYFERLTEEIYLIFFAKNVIPPQFG